MKNIIRTPETHPLTWRLRDDKQPVWLDEYRSKNGYEGARKALTGLSPDEIVNQVKDAGLKGRGGAGFSTGLKWSLMPKDESMNIRYLLCNADEMEPGTYKDRLLMEQLPHLLVEGMLISAFALKAYRATSSCVANISKRQLICAVPLPKPPKRVCLAKHYGNRFRFRTVRPYRGRALHLRGRNSVNQLPGRTSC